MSTTDTPTETYSGACPETGNYIEQEIPCPKGWTITQLSVWSITYQRKNDGITARHTVDDRPTTKITSEIKVEGNTVASGDISKQQTVTILSKLPSAYCYRYPSSIPTKPKFDHTTHQ